MRVESRITKERSGDKVAGMAVDDIKVPLIVSFTNTDSFLEVRSELSLSLSVGVGVPSSGAGTYPYLPIKSCAREQKRKSAPFPN